MIIIIDANIIIAALIRDSFTRKLIILSKIQLYYPEIMLEELREHKDEIMAKSGLDENTYDRLLKTILKRVVIIPTEQITDYLSEARKIMESIDIKDTPFIAAALSYENSIIWSDDKHFKRQKVITVYNTKEIKEILAP